MAEQRCHKLRMELEAARRHESTHATSSATRLMRDELRSIDLAALDAEKVDRLLGRALAEFDDTARTCVRSSIDGVLDGAARRLRASVHSTGWSRTPGAARSCSITAIDEVARLAANGRTADVGLRLDFARLSHTD